MLIPIGSWCRTAYQVNGFLERNGINKISYPYDWTITPFASLKRTLTQDFIPNNILRTENVVLSKFGSVADTYTGLIHHHDFSPAKLKKLAKREGLDRKGLPSSLYDSDLMQQAKGRFLHTFQNLYSLQQNQDKLLFVRWQRTGHPEPALPNVFEGESITSLAEVLSHFLLHQNFSILTVKSIIIQGELPCEPILEFNREKHGIESTIYERQGFDGDRSKNFRGDSIPWNRILQRYITEENMSLG